MRAPVARAAAGQKNAWYDVMWAARKRIDGASGPGGPAFDEVRDALCQLRQFPASNHGVARDAAALAPHACDDRQGVSLAALPFDVADRCAATYAWWRNPYRRETCADEPERVDSPAGYLLPYWMGRYHGFVPAAE
jgi:hypothetical protein